METALLDAASELLEQEGPDALSVRRIAAAAGVAPMGVYNHFTSKFGIINALFELGFERLSDALAEVSSIADPLEALVESGRCYRALALAQPMMYQLMFLRAVSGFEPSEDALVMAANAFNGLVTAVRRAMDSGQIIDGRCHAHRAHALGQPPRLGGVGTGRNGVRGAIKRRDSTPTRPHSSEGLQTPS